MFDDEIENKKNIRKNIIPILCYVRRGSFFQKKIDFLFNFFYFIFQYWAC
jgi:hypothetical protein